MINVKLPTGGTAQFPDGTPTETIEAALQQQFGGQQAQSPELTAAYADASKRSQFAPGQDFPGAAPLPASAGPDLMGSIATTLAGVNTIPVIGPALQNTSDAIMGGASQLAGGNYSSTVNALRARREELAKANPIANLAGSVGANLAAFGAGGASTVGAEALGMAGPTMGRVVNGGLSTLGLTTADNMMRGEAPTEALANAVVPGLAGAAIPAIGAGVRRGAEGVATGLTNRAQNGLTNAAIKGAPAAADLKSAASQMFDAATGGQPLAITDNAFFRFLGGVKQYSDKLRINPDNDPQATGLLSTLMRIADETSQGVAVDLKDLHLVRQLARKVAGSSQGRDASLGGEVVRQLDGLISTLKPDDILGGADPSAAATSLLKGISTWSRARKVGVIEEAITKAQTYKSGLENGLRLQFQAMLRNPETRKLFTAAERRAIEDVANGTTKSNLVTLLGKFGFGTNGAGNMLGGTIGSTLGATAGSIFGPAGSLIGAGLTSAGGAAARALSERIGLDAANRAAQVVATPNIPIAAQRVVPPALMQGVAAAELAGKGLAVNGMGQ